MKKTNGITVSEAKNTFDNGNVRSIRADSFMGTWNLIVCTGVAEKVVITFRGQPKAYTSMNALLADYQLITSKQATSFLIK